MKIESDKRIGKRIKDSRELQALSQGDLAQLSGLAQPTISAYELGARVPSEKTLKKLAQILNVEYDYLRGTATVVQYTPTQEQFLKMIEEKQKVDAAELKNQKIKLVIDGKEASQEEIDNAISLIVGMRAYKARESD